MGEVVDFKQRNNALINKTDLMFTMSVWQDSDGALVVESEIADGPTDYEVFEAIMAVAWKYAEDSGLVEDQTELEIE